MCKLQDVKKNQNHISIKPKLYFINLIFFCAVHIQLKDITRRKGGSLCLNGLPRINCFVACLPKYGIMVSSMESSHDPSSASYSRNFLFKASSKGRVLANQSCMYRFSLSGACRYFIISTNLFRGIVLTTSSLLVSSSVL